MPAAFARRRSRRWIGFFVVLAVLSAVGIILPLVYNVSIQLRPQQLAEARRRWQENGPTDYDLEHLIKRQQGGEAQEEVYFVQVRGGRVVLVADRGEVVYVDPALAAIAGIGVLALSLEDAQSYSVPALFDEIEEALRRSGHAKEQDYIKADFDPQDGHPYHYVDRIRRKKERVEWFVKLTRVATP